MRVVVNRLTFREPIEPALVEAAREGERLLLEAGGLSFRFVRIDDTHAFLVLAFPDAETEERVTREIGGPWMRDHVVPLLAGPTDRVSGDVL